MMNRAVSAEETTISVEGESPPKKKTGEIKKDAAARTKSLEPAAQDNYECSICLSWLKDPVLTSCGHRFCKSCLDEWRKKKNTKCPLDDMNLSIEDIFPDNFTKREIENMRKSFPEQFDPPNPIFECNFSTLSCDFKTSDPTEIEAHMEKSAKEHMELLLRSHLKAQYRAWDPCEKSPTNDEQQQQSTTRELINSMYERIVILEQLNREQALKIEKLQQIATKSNGTLVWRIKDFHKKIAWIRENPAVNMLYSEECFTDPNGYKFCARIRLSPNVKDCLSFFIHLMKSENDDHLSWPFIGRIKISMIHKDQAKSQHDTVMSSPDVLSFHRPVEDISSRSFGFQEHSLITDIIKRGFINNDCLSFKVHLNIV